MVDELIGPSIAPSGFVPVMIAVVAGAEMAGGDRSRAATFGLWCGVAVLLSGAALGGTLFLRDAGEDTLGLIRRFAAGAVVASLSTEVFPKAFREERTLSEIAAAVGLIAAVGLGRLA